MSRRPTQQYSRTSSYQTVEDYDDSDDGDDWRDVQDPSERRKIQNRLAQRKFRQYINPVVQLMSSLLYTLARLEQACCSSAEQSSVPHLSSLTSPSLTPLLGEKAKAAREESIVQSQNEAAAGNAYSQPDPNQLGPDEGHSGLPWGGVSIRHVVERGQLREKSRHRAIDPKTHDHSMRQQPQGHTLELPTRHRPSMTQHASGEQSRRTPPSSTQQNWSGSGTDSGRHDQRQHSEGTLPRNQMSSSEYSAGDYLPPHTRSHRGGSGGDNRRDQVYTYGEERLLQHSAGPRTVSRW